jgi:hypothetical protein
MHVYTSSSTGQPCCGLQQACHTGAATRGATVLLCSGFLVWLSCTTHVWPSCTVVLGHHSVGMWHGWSVRRAEPHLGLG